MASSLQERLLAVYNCHMSPEWQKPRLKTFKTWYMNATESEGIRCITINSENCPHPNQYAFECLSLYDLFLREKYSPEEYEAGRESAGEQGAFPINVNIAIGGTNIDFQIRVTTGYTKNQILIYTNGEAKSYHTILDDWTEDIEQQRKQAQLMLQSIENDQQPNFTGAQYMSHSGNELVFSDEQMVQAAAELIIVTQVAEAAPPNSAVPPTKWEEEDIKTGRVPGADNLARVFLQEIADGSASFQEVFIGDKALFVSARHGGTGLMRKVLAGESIGDDEEIAGKINDAIRKMSVTR